MAEPLDVKAVGQMDAAGAALGLEPCGCPGEFLPAPALRHEEHAAAVDACGTPSLEVADPGDRLREVRGRVDHELELVGSAGHQREDRVVATAGLLGRRTDRAFDPQDFTPAALVCERGVSGQGTLAARFIVTGGAGTRVTLRYEAEKAAAIEKSIKLGESTLPRQ